MAARGGAATQRCLTENCDAPTCADRCTEVAQNVLNVNNLADQSVADIKQVENSITQLQNLSESLGDVLRHFKV